jgi:hypothetical protein
MAVIEIAKIQVRRGQEHVTGVPQLDSGEFGWAEDTQHLYIGKRISEGASNDENTRILTDLDLRTIFDIIGGGQTGSAASTSTYRYRDSLSYDHFRSTTTSIARKLDNGISLTDFTQTTLSGDITSVLRTAITDIYANTYYGTDTIRTLKLPAGEFSISGVVDLPPLVSLVGEGQGITKLVLTSSGTPLFRTVDSLGAHYEQGMQFDGRASKGISIKDMTLAYAGHYSNDSPLISLDNTENPKIHNVEFTTVNTTTGFVSSGVGVLARGSIGVDESTVICRDISISDCKFSLLDTAIVEDGEVSKTIIENNNFSNLNQGVRVTTTSSSLPSDILISKNKFSFVSKEAVWVTTSSNFSRVVSSENQYYYVGNNSSGPDQDTNYPAFPVLTFNAPGNVSLNDYFNRVDCPYTSGYYYNPIANGNARIINNRTYNYTSVAHTTNDIVVNIPITGQDQLVTIEYQLSNSDMSRKGRLTINVSPDNFVSVSDYYNFSEVTDGSSEKIIFSTDDSNVAHNYVSLTCSNFSASQTELEYSVDITV